MSAPGKPIIIEITPTKIEEQPNVAPEPIPQPVPEREPEKVPEKV